jgi:UDP-N-acetylglucosamine--N-acetylmuramyl-(pentapeptide) pyrophosphoryl-undecaprenol N-acetylglucosamine transferase
MAIRPVLIMAGGTGGHVYPALAIAEYLRNKGVQLYWLGTNKGLESRVVPQNNFPLLTIKVSGLRGTNIFRWILAPFAVLVAIAHALKIMINIRPSLVIGMGGFVSGPGGIAAWILRIPLLIHEQNSIAGLTNKILSPFSRIIMQGFPNALTGKKVITTGNPVRLEIIQKANEFGEKKQAEKGATLHILVLGGSLGARILNNIVPVVLAKLSQDINIETLHQTGTAHLEATVNTYEVSGIKSDGVVSYIEDMAQAYSWADLVICRSGALTVSEISVMGLASIFIPYPYAVDDHQTMNAKYLADSGGGVLLPENELNDQKLLELITDFHNKRESIVEMSSIARNKAMPNATETIGNLCMEIVNA